MQKSERVIRVNLLEGESSSGKFENSRVDQTNPKSIRDAQRGAAGRSQVMEVSSNFLSVFICFASRVQSSLAG